MKYSRFFSNLYSGKKILTREPRELPGCFEPEIITDWPSRKMVGCNFLVADKGTA
jgi:hypothetical protein